MVGWLDSDWLRMAGYVAVAVAALLAGLRERRLARTEPTLWPSFWFLTAGLFLVMAIGRAGHVAELATDLGRREAFAEGWYANRRRYQPLVIASVAGAWFVAVAVVLWRMPQRRRYLPMTLVTITLGCFAAVRLVSFHDVDVLLYYRDIAGVRLGAFIEGSLLAIALALTFWQPRPSDRRSRGGPTAGVDGEAGLAEHDPGALL